MKILNHGFDHVEFVVQKVAPHAKMYERIGFEKTGERLARGLRTECWSQGFVRILLTEPVDGKAEATEEARFLSEQAEGVCLLAVDVDDARAVYAQALAKGARSASEPQVFESPQGRVVRAEIWTPGNVRYALIERHYAGSVATVWDQPALLDRGLVVKHLKSPAPLAIKMIDHLTNNVGIGEMPRWVDWYKQVFGFEVTRHFKIRTGRTGLISDVVQSIDRKVTVPINEPTEKESQVYEFVERMRGPGVQHLAFLTTDIPKTLRGMREAGHKFLTVPHTYYEEVPTRVPGVKEDLRQMEDLGILLDGDESGYILQIFS